MSIQELLTFDTEDSSTLLITEGLPDLTFAETDPDKIMTNLVAIYENFGGRTLSPSDPVYLAFKVITYGLVSTRQRIDYTGKQNLLAYARGGALDHLGVLVGTKRIDAMYATTTVKITLSETRSTATIVPVGTRITAGDNVFFALSKDVTIAAGELTASATATCLTAGTAGNGYIPGQIKTIVDNVAFVKSIVNTDTSSGGAEEEADDQLRERIHIAPESFSSAGPPGAYEYHALSANSGIVDIYVEGPEARAGERPGEVDIYVLMDGGQLPGSGVLEEVRVKCDDKSVRPLTDKVNVKAPTKKTFNFAATYYIAKSKETTQGSIQLAVSSAVNDYIVWQRSKMGRDIEPTELIYRMRAAGAKRVEPAFVHTVVGNNEIAWADGQTITYGGLEDD